MATARTRRQKPSAVVDRLIVVGASAGGIEALSVVVSELPASFPAAIVVAQHLHPDHPSSLVEIIGRRTDLRVIAIEDRMALERGAVYLVPPNRHVTISDHEVRLDDDDPSRPKPSVDRLLESAAEVFGDRLIAVILSGTGSDGAAGAQDVAAAGGTVIAQDPETASFPSMPRSLSPQTVDAVVRLEGIGALLEALVSGSTTIKSDDDTLDRFLGQLRDQSGIDFAAYKRPTIARRVERRMAATQSATLAEYRRFVARNPDEIHRLTSSLLIKVTEFFRDQDTFVAIRGIVIPALIEAARDSRELRLWSAGCATGQEAYSLAMIVADVLGPALPTWNIRIFATDADPEAIAFARRGVYPASALRPIETAQVARHFRAVDGEYEVGPHIRAMIVFGEHDLGQRAPFPRIDLVLCRNVLIYFTPELQRRALQLFAFSLRDDGYLVLGKSEPTNPLPSSFVIENTKLRIFRRSGDRILIPSGPVRGGLALEERRRSPAAAPRALAPEPLATGRARPRSAGGPNERAESILLRLPIGVCVLDAAYDIQFLNGAARSLLGIHGSAIGQDFVHHARAIDSGRLRGAIDQALGGETVHEAFEISSETPVGEARFVDLTVAPLSLDAAAGDRVVLVTIVDVTEERAASETRAADFDRRTAELERLTSQLERQLTTNADLLRGNEELAAANAELRTANQELLVYNEELQAASEEVETLNEELQATIEELETLNEELQSTIEELNTANDDLAARAAEDIERAAANRAGLRVVPPPTERGRDGRPGGPR